MMYDNFFYFCEYTIQINLLTHPIILHFPDACMTKECCKCGKYKTIQMNSHYNTIWMLLKLVILIIWETGLLMHSLGSIWLLSKSFMVVNYCERSKCQCDVDLVNDVTYRGWGKFDVYFGF